MAISSSAARRLACRNERERKDLLVIPTFMTSESNTQSSSFFNDLDAPTYSGKEESNGENLKRERQSLTRVEGTNSKITTTATVANTASSKSKEIETGATNVNKALDL